MVYIAALLAALALVVGVHGWIEAYRSYVRYRAAREAAAIRRMLKIEMTKLASSPTATELAKKLATRDLACWDSREEFLELVRSVENFLALPKASLEAAQEASEENRAAVTDDERLVLDRLFGWVSVAIALEGSDFACVARALRYVRVRRREARLIHAIRLARPASLVTRAIRWQHGRPDDELACA